MTKTATDLEASVFREELEYFEGTGLRSRDMIRIIKRYESRKLYDTEESRYVSLEEIGVWVRDGQEIRVVDNATSEDVTAQVLTQIILEEGKRGISFLPTELLHELVRVGEHAVSNGFEQVQGQVDRFIRSSIDRLAPLRQAREEMSHLRDRLEELEKSLASLELGAGVTKKPASRKSRSRKTQTMASAVH